MWNHVFALGGAATNLLLKGSLKPGDPIEIEWPGCNSSSYAALAVAPYTGQDAALLDQSTTQVTVLVRAGIHGGQLRAAGRVHRGDADEPCDARGRGAGTIQAEIGVSDTTVPRPMARRITINVSVSKRRARQRSRSAREERVAHVRGRPGRGASWCRPCCRGASVPGKAWRSGSNSRGCG